MKTLTILGGREPVRQAETGVERTQVLWDSAGDDDNAGCISLPRLLDGEHEALQRQYVEWRDALSHQSYRGQSLEAALDLNVPHGGSLWWGSTIAATPTESHERVADVLKLRLLERIVTHGAYDRLAYFGENSPLATVLSAWCSSEGRAFAWTDTAKRERGLWPGKRPLLRMLPHTMQALWYLKSFVSRRIRIGPSRRDPGRPVHDPDVAVVTFFPNISARAEAAGRFESRYWGGLHRLIETLGVKVSWLWFFTDSPEMQLGEAVAFRDMLNAKTPVTGQSYAFLEERVGPRDAISALGVYLRLLRAGFRFRSLKQSFQFEGSSVNFFPLLKEHWHSSLCGTHAMFMSLYAVACRSAVAGVPKSASRMLYVWENQSWEYLLLDAWKAARKSPAVGVVHTPACSSPMLLRNRLGRRQQSSARVLGPDRLVTIGPFAAAALRTFGWPTDVVVEAEALRYEHLAGTYGTARRATPDSNRTLLVLTSIVPSEVRLQFDLLAQAERLGALDQYASVSIKAHPFCGVDAMLEQVPFIQTPCLVNEPLQNLLERVDVVFSASATSASVEVAWMGLPLILLGAAAGLNLSPFQAAEGVRFVVTAAELATQLRDPVRIQLDHSYFVFAAGLPRWVALLTAPLPASCLSEGRQTPGAQGWARC